jgi:phosphomannomutase
VAVDPDVDRCVFINEHGNPLGVFLGRFLILFADCEVKNIH